MEMIHFAAAGLLMLSILGITGPVMAQESLALTRLREGLPIKGNVLIDAGEGSAIRPSVTDGTTSEVVEVADAAPFKTVARIRIGKTYDLPYRVQFFSENSRIPVKKGDVVFLSCWVRAPEASGGATGLAGVYVQASGADWSSPASVSATADNKWRQVYASGTADRDYAAGGLQVAVHLGYQQQVIDMAGLVVLNLGAGVDMSKLPYNEVRWNGMEDDAPWRAKAQERIEQYRMGELAIKVTDANGRPLANVPVHVEQQTSAFTIGSFTGYRVVEDSPDGEKLRQTYHRLFNRATAPIYWADWGWPNQKDRYLAIGKWLTDNGFVTRGHVMVYPGFKFMPKDVVALKSDPEKLRARILQQVAEISEATKPFGYREYDVTNELRQCVDLHELLGRDAVAEWYEEARKHLPSAKLALNENSILTGGGATEANQDLYLDWYRFLKSKGVAPDVMGFQGHFGEDLTAPDKVYEILERFAKETTAELQITEFDINTLDEEAQAQYTRDFMTICFSHPRVTGFTMWGFWEGDHWLPRAAFYREDWTAKPNAVALEELLTKTWRTNQTVTTDAQGVAKLRAFLGSHKVTATIGGKSVETTAALTKPGARTDLAIEAD